jgi:type I restriction enzyme S subunit
MIYNKSESFKLKNLCEIKYGKDHKSLKDGLYPVYGSGGIIRYVDSFIHDKPSVLIPRKGTLSNLFFCNDKFWTVDTIFWTKINNDLVNPKFLYYKLLTLNLADLNVGSAVPSLTTTILNDIDISIPVMKSQLQIVDVLTSIDSKIEINNKLTQKLEEIAQTLYKRWFVDFEFPNEEGKPYKSSGGEMVDSELGLIPKGWSINKHTDYFPVITGKKNANVATNKGKYKFFTCSKEIFKTDDYSFNAEAILLAGNGDFNVKYYNGKFEAYQRTYVLIPINKKLTGLLYFEIKKNLIDLTKGSRGSVINFITKGLIEDYKIIMPEEKKLASMSDVFYNILNIIANNDNQNETLSNLRDLLLPKLMSGEIEVPVME